MTNNNVFFHRIYSTNQCAISVKNINFRRGTGHRPAPVRWKRRKARPVKPLEQGKNASNMLHYNNLNSVSAMETGDYLKNGAGSKCLMSKRNKRSLFLFIGLFFFCVSSLPRPPRPPFPPHPVRPSKIQLEIQKEISARSNNYEWPNTDEFVTFCGLDILIADLPGRYEWASAQRACPKGWWVPTSDELKCICDNKGRIGGFSGNQYWTSDEDPQKRNRAITYILSNGKVRVEDMLNKYFVRCVSYISEK